MNSASPFLSTRISNHAPRKTDVLGAGIAAMPVPASAISLCAMSKVPELRVILISLCTVSCLLYMALNFRKIHPVVSKLWPIYLLAAFYFVDLAIHPTANGLKHAISIISVVVIIAFYISFGAQFMRSSSFRLVLFLEALLLMCSGMLGLNEKNYDLGAALYGVCLMYYLYICGKRHERRIPSSLIVFSFLTMLGIAYDFRAIIYISLLIFGLFSFFNSRDYSNFRSTLMFFSLLLAFLAFLYLYLNINEFQFTQDLNVLVQDKTGRQLTSGRQKLWPFILEEAMNAPIYGMGGEVLPKDFLSSDFSSHNYFLQLFLQKGFTGLALLLMFCVVIWRLLNQSRWTDARTNFSAAVFLAFLTHNMTEVLMFQNALIISVPAWIVISLGISQASVAVRPIWLNQAKVPG